MNLQDFNAGMERLQSGYRDYLERHELQEYYNKLRNYSVEVWNMTVERVLELDLNKIPSVGRIWNIAKTMDKYLIKKTKEEEERVKKENEPEIDEETRQKNKEAIRQLINSL